MRIQEWDYLDGSHAYETVCFLVIEQGEYQLPDGTRLEANRFEANATQEYMSYSFKQTYRVTPTVMTTINSFNGSDAVTERIRDVTAKGFNLLLQEQEANAEYHTYESIAYLVWEPSVGELEGISYQIGKTPNAVTHEWYNIMFPQAFSSDPVMLTDMQTANGSDTANIRWADKDDFSADVMIDEEQSCDEETNHVAEVVGYMVFNQ